MDASYAGDRFASLVHERPRAKEGTIRSKVLVSGLIWAIAWTLFGCGTKVWKPSPEPAVTPEPTSVITPTPSGRSSDEGMVYVPEGWFTMGSEDGDEDEQPVHRVWVDGFWMDQYEVMVAQFREFCRATGREMPDQPSWNRANHPVVNVSWHDAQAYAKWADKRLPTEAEWEKAARGVLLGKAYPWGDHIDRDRANRAGTGGEDRWEYTAPVRSFLPNGYGLYNLAGNVREWCADWYGESTYRDSPERNPTGPTAGTFRVVRGGSWSGGPKDGRCADRHWNVPTHTWDNVGFRCARSSSR